MPRPSFRQLLAENRPLVTPGAHDALSARLITLAGFKAIGVGGSSMLAAQQALPDIGLAALADMIEGARCILRGTDLPWGMDGDDGYGDVKSVVRTVRSFVALGCGQIVLEDQGRMAKRPGDAQSAVVVPPQEMARKVRAAIDARDTADMIVLARTDAVGSEGLDGALRRAETYLRAGADGIFVAGLQTVEQLERVGATLRGNLQMAVVTERLMKTWPGPADLYAMGFSQVAYPNFIIARAAAAMRSGLGELAEVVAGVRPQANLPSFTEAAQGLQELLGLADWRQIERRFGSAD